MSVRARHLPWLLALAPALLACSEERDGAGPARPGYSRVAAVKANKPPARPEQWCDIHHPPAKAPKLRLPAVLDEAGRRTAVRLSGERHTWVNLWATWCKPCIREMPLLGRIRATLAVEKRPLDLVFISLDEDAAKLAAYLAAHPRALPSPARRLRLAKPAIGTDWLARYGLRQEATLPIQLLLSPGGKLRCLRAGSLSDGDYRTIRSLLDAR